MDNRKHERLPVQYAASFSGESFHASGDLVDLSTNGCRVRSAGIFNKSERVTVQIYVPRYEEFLSVPTAAVRWSDGLDIGLEFVQMDAKHEPRLRN